MANPKKRPAPSRTELRYLREIERIMRVCYDRTRPPLDEFQIGALHIAGERAIKGLDRLRAWRRDRRKGGG